MKNSVTTTVKHQKLKATRNLKVLKSTPREKLINIIFLFIAVLLLFLLTIAAFLQGINLEAKH